MQLRPGHLRTIILALLIAAWVVAVAWLVKSPHFEPVLSAIVLLASMTTLYADHWIAEQERRRELLRAVVHELFVDRQVLADPLFSAIEAHRLRIFPRLAIGTIINTIASGVFTTSRDRELFRLMHAWREQAEHFNHLLDIMEIQLLVALAPQEIAALPTRLAERPAFATVREALRTLSEHLLHRYASDSGITRDSILFASEGVGPTTGSRPVE